MLVEGFDEMMEEMARNAKNGAPEMPIYDSSGQESVFSEKSQYTKGTCTLVGGFTGSGKTTFVDSYFILSPYYEYVTSSQRISTLPFWIYFVLERGIAFKMSKWTAFLYRKMFGHNPGDPILTTAEIFNWKKKKFTPSAQQIEKIKEIRNFLIDMEPHVDLKTGSKTAKAINDYCMKTAFKKGTLYDADIQGVKINGSLKYVHYFKDGGFKTPEGVVIHPSTKKYIPFNEEEMVINITDHIGKILSTGNQNDKSVLDEHGTNNGELRDIMNWSPLDIVQFNDEMINSFRNRTKKDDDAPKLRIYKTDFKGTRVHTENADVVIGMMDPANVFNLDKYTDQDNNLIDLKKNFNYKEIQIIKNTYGKLFSFGIDFDGRNGWITERQNENRHQEMDFTERHAPVYTDFKIKRPENFNHEDLPF